eukprot:scaffold11158_cov73-Isochrysis_galbana.AAC.2
MPRSSDPRHPFLFVTLPPSPPPLYSPLGSALANSLICSLTTSMPRSSDALSSSTIDANRCLPYILCAQAKMVEVLPVPGGPYSSKWGSLPASMRRVMVPIISS